MAVTLMPPPELNASSKLVVVCVEDHPKSILLLRMARRRAQEAGSLWRAVFIETPAQLRLEDDSSHERLLRLMTMAGQMGAQTVHMEAESLETGLAAILQKEAGNIERVLVGSIKKDSWPANWLAHWHALPWMRMVRVASQYAQVEVLPLTLPRPRRPWRDTIRLRRVHVTHLLYALLAVAAAGLFSAFLEWLRPFSLYRVNGYNVALVFMIACAFISGRFGLLPGLVASVAGFLTMNYYFTLPYYAFKLTNVADIIDLGLFFAAAALISLFASQGRDFAKKAARREMSTQALFTLYRIASEALSRDQALSQLQTKLAHMLDMQVAFFMPSLLRPECIEPAFPKDLLMSEADRKALEACWTNLRTTGAASSLYPGTGWRFEPMIASSGELGVLGVNPTGKNRLDTWLGQLLPTIADQTAAILEHIDLKSSIEFTRIREEREKLRAMLLSSVSHDLKTPLAGIIGALGVYRSLGERLTPQKREELIEAAIEEAQRLDSFITNILDMTRLESGNIQFRQEWHDVESMIASVTKRLQHRLRNHKLMVHPAPEGIEVYMDAMMTGQVLQNVLDNAGKYTPAGTIIDIRFTIEEGKGFICEVRDHGNGLPPGKIDKVFDKYERSHKKDLQVAGTGLGLAISRAIMEAQGGWITAGNHPDGGALFTFCLPQWRHTHAAPSYNMIQGKNHAALEQEYCRH